MGGLIFAAPASGSGKTTVTLGFLRAARQRGIPIKSAKSGPDYIDPKFHAAATGADCINLDAWAMRSDRICTLAAHDNGQTLIVEGAMGLFDGAPPDNKGSSADLARTLGLPVVLIVDCGRMAGSLAALVNGFANFDPQITVAGVILNNVGSPRHETMLRRALAPLGIAIYGAVPRSHDLSQPSRHLGLMQAEERTDLEQFLDHAAAIMESHLDIDGLLGLAAPVKAATQEPRLIAPPAQTIAVAHDRAFGFCYPHLLADWRAQGADIKVFSPLADDQVPDAEFIYLPGGYPELHAGQIASNTTFMQSLRNAAQTSEIYGECGGYMTLGEGLVDGDGQSHQMAGLLPLGTSFAQRKLHLGYRDVTADRGLFKGAWKAHEFHYATTLYAKGQTLFTAQDAEGTILPDMGLRLGNVAGSFAHLIDQG